MLSVVSLSLIINIGNQNLLPLMCLEDDWSNITYYVYILNFIPIYD